MLLPRCIALALLLFLLGASSWLAAQPPRKEEEEEAPAKARPVVPVPVAEPDKKGNPRPAAEPIDLDVETMPKEVAKASHPEAKNFFKIISIPYDRMTSTFQGGPTYRVEMLPFRDLPESEFEIKKLDLSLKNSTPQKLATGSGFRFSPYEMIILEQVDLFLERTITSLTRAEQLEIAARAVAVGLRWHLLMVSNNKRVGKGWDEVEKLLKNRLLKLQRDRFAALISAKEYDKADELGLKLLTRNPENNEILKDVYGFELLRVHNSLKVPTDEQLLKLRDAMLQYDRLPGEKNAALIDASRKRLKSRASELIAEAKDLDAKKQTAAGLAKLRQAESLDPEVAGINNVRAQLRGKVLYVGVSQLPLRMSPTLAASDAERWAVELLFEGLMQPIPDAEMVRYRPCLAETMPGVMPLGRSFTLPKNLAWSQEGRDLVDARDVRGTLQLLRKPGVRERWCGEGLDVFREIDRIDDPFRLRLAYEYGVLEPLSRATFKVLPARYLQEQGKGADDDLFAKKPFGSGPFRYEEREEVGTERECVVFRANPYYAQRGNKFGLPFIREIRFFVPTPSSYNNDVAAGQLHFYPDAPPEAVARTRQEDALRGALNVVKTKTNRRIHLLAINHRRLDLQNDKLRQGLSAAIDREQILKDLYRPTDPLAHVALTGPFPPKCWATPETARTASLHKPGAGGLIEEGLAGKKITLRLTFNKTEAKQTEVAQMLKGHIEKATAGRSKVQIDLVALDGERFREKVYMEHDYDLALTTFDYRDDLYSLGGLLDPTASGRHARNFMGYLAPGTGANEADRRLRRLLDDLRQYRDFTKQVRERTWDVHALFNQRVPFVPLWQLDRYMILHKDLDVSLERVDAVSSPELLDPATLFTGIEMWRLK